MKKIIIDCDPGIDDFITLMIANTLVDAEVLGITTVAGNGTVDICTQNALDTVKFLNMENKVYKGADKPLYTELFTATEVHGENGLRSIELLKSNKKHEELIAHKYLSKTVLNNPNEIDILAIGPLTNIAKMIITYPETAKLVRQITIMGGGHKHGNVTPTAEFNIFADPEAAKIVFESGANIVLVPLDATMSEGLTSSEIDSLFTGKLSENQSVFKQALDECINISNEFDLNKAHLHDPLALFALLNPKEMSGERYYVNVDLNGELTRGKTIVDIMSVHNKKDNLLFYSGFNKEAFLKFIKQSIDSYE